MGPDGIKLTPTQDAWYTITTGLAQGAQAFFTAAGAYALPHSWACRGGAYTRQGMLAPLSLLALLLAWRRMTSASRSSKILDTCTGTSAREDHQGKTTVSRFLALKCNTIREKTKREGDGLDERKGSGADMAQHVYGECKCQDRGK